MTVSTTTNKSTATGNGVTTLFGFPIPFIAASDLQVYISGILKTLTTDYTISGSAPYTSGANVTFLTAPANGAVVLIVRVRPYTQTLDLVANDPLPADSVEQLLGDHQVMLIQQLKEITDRSLTLALTDTSGASLTLPTPVASQLLGWNAAANAIINYAGTTGVTVSSYWSSVISTASAVLLYGGTAGGTANALTSAVAPVPAAYAAGQIYFVKASASNTGAATLQDGSKAATAIRVETPAGLSACSGKEIISGNTYMFIYDGTFMVLLNPSAIITAMKTNETVITSTGNFTTDADSSTATIYEVEMQAPGGGGGGANGVDAIGGGGGEGEWVKHRFTGIAPSTAISVTMGAAGTAGSAAGSAGGDGGDITIGSPVSLVAKGGKGGGGSTSAASTVTAGGDGGTGGSGTANERITGRKGLPGVFIAGVAGFGGHGADSKFGGGGKSYTAAGAAIVTPTAAVGFGSGGGAGGGAAQAGTAGAGGIAIFRRL